METPSFRKNAKISQADDISQASDYYVVEQEGHRGRGVRRIIYGALLGWISRAAKNKIAALVVLALIAGVSYGAYEKFFNLSPEERAQKQLAAAVTAVGRHMILPEGDEPVLATVTDAETLKAQQPFFAGAKNGDQLLLFPRSVKAVIYSPSRDRIVNVGPIQQPAAAGNTPTESNPNTATATTTTTAPVSVEVRNGSGKDGVGLAFAEKIAKDSRFIVLQVTDAKSNDYKNTVVVDVAKKAAEQDTVNALVSALGASVVSALPKAEAPSNADVVVIIGSNAHQ